MAFISEILEHKERNLAIAVSAIVGGVYITNLSEGMTWLTGVSAYAVSNICKALILVLLLLCAGTIVERMNKKMLIVCSAVIAVPILQAILFPDTWVFFKESYQSFLISIFPGMICFAVIRDYDRCLKALVTVSVVISVINLAVMLIWGGDAFPKYNMGYANALVLPTNLLLWEVISRGKTWRQRVLWAVMAATNLIGIFVYGSRGALACVAVFCVFLFFKTPIPGNHGRHIKLGIVLIMIPLLIFYKPILTFVLDIFNALGFESRTLSLLITDIGHDSNRSVLWQKVWSDFAADPLLIRGINSDYGIIGIYSHNALLELLHALGIIGTVILLDLAVWGIVNTFTGKADSYGRVRTLMLFCFFPLCLWSNSVWTSMYLWLWVMVCLRKDRPEEKDFGGVWIKKIMNLFKRKKTVAEEQATE